MLVEFKLLDGSNFLGVHRNNVSILVPGSRNISVDSAIVFIFGMNNKSLQFSKPDELPLQIYIQSFYSFKTGGCSVRIYGL